MCCRRLFQTHYVATQNDWLPAVEFNGPPVELTMLSGLNWTGGLAGRLSSSAKYGGADLWTHLNTKSASLQQSIPLPSAGEVDGIVELDVHTSTTCRAASFITDWRRRRHQILCNTGIIECKANVYNHLLLREFTRGEIAEQGLARARKLSKGTDQSSSCVI